MKNETCIISPDFIKSMSNISDNTSDKYLLPAIREAQDIDFRNIVGYAMLEKLKELNDSDTLNDPKNIQYKELLEESKYFLTYATMVHLTMKTSYKIANMGVVRTSDDNVTSASYEEVRRIADYYRSRADFFKNSLQRYLCYNRSRLPELSEELYNQAKAQLRSSATTSIWLGGVRGKKQ